MRRAAAGLLALGLMLLSCTTAPPAEPASLRVSVHGSLVAPDLLADAGPAPVHVVLDAVATTAGASPSSASMSANRSNSL